MELTSYSAEETFAIGRQMGEKAQAGEVYCLTGDLGTGKTVFTKGFAKGLQIDENVKSPTFTIIEEHKGRLSLYHFDVYRIEDPGEMEEIGYEDYFYGDGVCIIEWAELIEELLPQNAKFISIQKDLTYGTDYRRITVL